MRVDKDNRVAYFKNNAADGEEVAVEYDFLHIVPNQKSHDFIATSDLAAENGYVDVDQFSLQHKKYSNVFALGDAANLPCSKTAAATFSQAPVLVHNLLREMGNHTSQAKADGYSSCPVFVGDKKLMLCEFTYDNQNNPSFFKDQSVPRGLFYRFKKEVFPRAYFSLMPRGLWFGRNGLLRPRF